TKYPTKSTQEQPEKDWRRLSQFRVEMSGSAIEQGCKEKNSAQLAEGEYRHEGERIHAADVRLTIGDVHRSPKDAGTQRSNDPFRASQRVSALKRRCVR